jgi:probable F420-dependent oxidoreductase
MRPFRFGATVGTMTSKREWADTAKRVADAGFAVLTVVDHLGAPTGVWGALVAAHHAAPSLRVGTLVLNNDLWNPAVLAREAMTVDVLTDGSLELGIGAGWSVPDYTRSGITRAEPSVRVARLTETVQILRRAFAGETGSFAGAHYHLEDTVPLPRPVQSPIPLLVGGGSPRVLRMAGRCADIVSIHRNMQHGSGASWASETAGGPGETDAVAQRVAHVREGAGERFGSVELNSLVLKAIVTNDRRAVLGEISSAMGVPEPVLEASPAVLVGTVGEIVASLRERRERWGISYLTLAPGNDVAAFAPVVGALAGT